MSWNRASRLGVGAIAVFSAVLMIRLLTESPRLIDVLVSVGVSVFGALYFSAVFLTVGWAVRRLRGRAPASVPFVSGRWASDRRLIWAVVAVAVLGTMWREGAFAPWSTLNLSWYNTQRHVTAQTSTSTSTVGTGLPHGVHAHIHASPPAPPQVICAPYFDPICRAVRRELAHPRPHGAATTVSVSLSGASSPLCYMPLVKSMQVRAMVNIGSSIRGPRGTTSRSTSVDLRVDQQTYGVASCLQFRRQLGRAIARKVHDSL